MRTAVDVLAVERRNLGVAENPPGSNLQPYAAIAGHKNGLAWCATFQVACFRRAGIKLGNESASCQLLYDSLPHVAVGDVQVGDLGFIYFPNLGRLAHVFIVESVEPGGKVVITIEGNTDEAGGRTGGKVMRHRRSVRGISFARPAYAPAKPVVVKPAPAKPKARLDPVLRVGNRGQSVLNVQRALNRAAGRRYVAENAIFDEAMKRAVMKFQAKEGLTADGVVGDATWAALRKYPAKATAA